jgi:hypothetical protein
MFQALGLASAYDVHVGCVDIGLLQDGVRHSCTDEHARDLGHDIIQAL